MALHKDEAVVLFKRAYGESDRIIRLYTLASGKVAAIAKGGNRSQKRFMNTLEPFNHIRVEYFEKHGKGMVRIENADIIESNSGIETSLKKACAASFFVEFVDRLTKERERQDELFFVLVEVLQCLRDAEMHYVDVLRYQLRILETLGYMPNFIACVYCGKDLLEDKRVFFSKQRGGVLCPRCARFIAHKAYSEYVIPKLSSIRGELSFHELFSSFNSVVPELWTEREDGTVSGAREALLRETVEPYGTFEQEAQDIMEGFISFHLDVEFKSYRILKSVLFQ